MYMKALLLLAIATVNPLMAQASDTATCQVFVDYTLVKSTTVLHQDYDVKLSDVYSYRTYKRDEFYDLTYTYETNASLASTKLTVKLKGDEHEYLVQSSEAKVTDYSVTAKLHDHENHEIEVRCTIE